MTGTTADPKHSTSTLDLVKLASLMTLTRGSSQIRIGLIDGPVDLNHSDFAVSRIETITIKKDAACLNSKSHACAHGTFVAGMLSAMPGAAAPAICPGCVLLVRPIFFETIGGTNEQPSANPAELGAAIFDCIRAGARVINLSLALVRRSPRVESILKSALDEAMMRGVVIVAAAGNQSSIGSGEITGHPWVIPVAACDGNGLPYSYSNCGLSIGGRGLSAPGNGVASSGMGTQTRALGGTSISAPFVTGTVALLWSMFPSATGQEVRSAVTLAGVQRRVSIVPPLLDAWTAYQVLANQFGGGRVQ